MSSSSLCLQPPSPSAHFMQDEFANEADSAMDIEKPEQVKNTLKDLTTIIFDWDDTLLPSSWLSVKGLRLDYPAQLPQDVLDELETHQESVCAVLTKAIQCGTVVIITNAETGWVQLSAQRFVSGCFCCCFYCFYFFKQTTLMLATLFVSFFFADAPCSAFVGPDLCLFRAFDV